MILLVIDVQTGITDERLFAYDKFTENVQLLINEARKNGVEVVHVRHDDGKGSGFSIGDAAFEIDSRFEPISGEKVFDKDVNNAFVHYIGLDDYLETKGISKVIVTGLQTDYCIDATVKSAFERGCTVIIPEGTNTTFDNDYMTGETTVRYYNDDIWEELVESVTLEEALEMLES
jgi:nicotinamidase-related amidase